MQKDFELKDEKVEKIKQTLIACPKCGGFRFQQIFILKKVTPLEDPQLIEDAYMPIPIFQCKKCHALM